jgi:hypothetical protein
LPRTSRAPAAAASAGGEEEEARGAPAGREVAAEEDGDAAGGRSSAGLELVPLSAWAREGRTGTDTALRTACAGVAPGGWPAPAPPSPQRRSSGDRTWKRNRG